MAGVMVDGIAVPASVAELKLLDHVDYEDAFAVQTAAELTPEQWARLFFDGTSRLFRAAWWWLFSGFRFRFSPPGGPDHVFGWKILQNTPTEIVLGLNSPIGVTAHLITTTPPGQAVVSTLVRLETPTARAIWAVAVYGHRATMRYLVGHAATAATQRAWRCRG